MSTPTGGNLYTVAFGTRPENVEIPVYSTVNPGTNKTNYPIGKRWINTSSNSTFTLTSLSTLGGVTTATWTAEGGGSSQLAQLTGDTGTAIPTNGSIKIAGDTVNISTSASGSTVTITQSLTGTFSSLVANAAATNVTEWANLTTGTLVIGGTSQTGAISLGTGTATQTVNVNAGAGVKTTVIGSNNTTSTTTIHAGSGNLNLDSVNVIQSLSSVGVAVTNQVTNSDNTNAASNASYQVAVGGASAGDAYIDFLVSGAGHFSLGIDNSVSDNFVLAASGTLGTSNVASWTSAGALTNAGAITVTAGDVTTTNGNFVASTSGTGFMLTPVTISGASPQTANGRVFSVTFTGVSIASGASQAFDIANTSIVGGGTIVLVEWSGATAGSALSIQSQVSTAGHLTITMTNGTSATMVTSTADITFTGIVLN